jgi:hypothetical protein
VSIGAPLVADTAKRICGPDYHCYDLGTIESALHSAFYPGSYPFAQGGIAAIKSYRLKGRIAVPELDTTARRSQ